MPRIFDNIEQKLLPALQETLEVTDRADFCVGYFNLGRWKKLDYYIESWAGGEGNRCKAGISCFFSKRSSEYLQPPLQAP